MTVCVTTSPPQNPITHKLPPHTLPSPRNIILLTHTLAEQVPYSNSRGRRVREPIDTANVHVARIGRRARAAVVHEVDQDGTCGHAGFVDCVAGRLVVPFI